MAIEKDLLDRLLTDNSNPDRLHKMLYMPQCNSTELANDCRIPLASMTIRGKKVRICSDLDCDCGSRRNKRDKSVYVVGYRLHTLTVIDAESKQSFPLVSLVAPANHWSNFGCHN